jgi:hypothetical protein
MDLRRNLGSTVRQRRMELGLSQVQLAERMGGETQQSDISRIERGLLPWPRPQLLESLAAALYMTALELITQSGWMTQEELERYQGTTVPAPEKPLVVFGQHDAGDDALIREVLSPGRFRVLTTFDGRNLLENVRAAAPAVVIVHQTLPELDLNQLAIAIWEQRLDTAVIVIGHRSTIPAAFHFVQAPATSATIQAILAAIGYE